MNHKMMNEQETISIADKTKIPLKRVLGLPTGILLVAGIMIGSGVFKKIAPMSAALMSEPYILAAWIIAGIITMFGAFTLAGWLPLQQNRAAYTNICVFLLVTFFPFFTVLRFLQLLAVVLSLL